MELQVHGISCMYHPSSNYSLTQLSDLTLTVLVTTIDALRHFETG